MAIEIKENEVITFGDFRVTAECDREGVQNLKIATDNGYIKIQPKSGNTIIIESTKK